MIIGLEENNFCAHCPIPVKVTDVSSEVIQLQLTVNDEEVLVRPPVLCKNLDGEFLIDLSPWVKQFMPDMKDLATYTTTPVTISNPQIQTMIVEFFSQDYVDTVIRNFINCATDEWRFVSSKITNVKVWQCYPFSFPSANNYQLTYSVIQTEPTIPEKQVDYNADCCRGIYVKWLNRYGYYSYWLFPELYTRERSADEYYKVTQNIFDSNRDGSHRTVGFEAEDIITIRDKVSRKYIGMFADLVSSPEVQILNPEYVLGSDVTPDDWIRIIQDNPEMEDDAVNSTFDFEMDFTLPKRYTQTLI